MSTSLPSLDGTDPETPLSVLRRFGITTVTQDVDPGTVVASMSLAGMANPFTGQPSLAGLALLVDDVAGRVNYFRRGRAVWTVSSELTVEINPIAYDSLRTAPGEPVLATARGVGPLGSPMLACCELTHAGTVIGTGTVHTMAVDGGPPDEDPPGSKADPLVRGAATTLADLMAVEPLPAEAGVCRLRQLPDPMLNNLIGIVHGGVSSAALELVAAAAVNQGQSEPLRTASIRVNFLRPFFSRGEAGAESLYEGTALRIGRTVAVGDARAIGADGKTAVIARVTAYR